MGGQTGIDFNLIDISVCTIMYRPLETTYRNFGIGIKMGFQYLCQNLTTACLHHLFRIIRHT